MEPKHFFAKGRATLSNGPANLLNNDPKNPSDWTILEILALEKIMSIDILLLNAFLSFAFCLIGKNNSWGSSFSSKF